jgi:integrase
VSKTYLNPNSFRDGKILLYNRENSSVIQVRLKIDGLKGYIVKSTKKRDLEEALKIAEDLYDDYRYKVRNELDIGTYTFATLYKKWWEVNKNTLSIHRKKYIEGTTRRYFLPYFGKKSTNAINDIFVEQYWDWRINYWDSVDGGKKIEAAKKSRTTKNKPYKNVLGNVAKVPAQKTLQMEQSLLRQIFYWAKRTGRIKDLPLVKAPKLERDKNVNRRPAFELDEWRLLTKFMRNWTKEKYNPTQLRKNGSFSKSKNEKIKRPHSLHLFQREMVRNYILFLGYSGLRPNEARQLRWCDLNFNWIDKEGRTQILIFVAPTTKTGEREVVPIWYARTPLRRLKKLSKHTDQNDLVFCDRDGNAIENFGKTFKDILRKSGLLEDRNGKVRTIYSLRHTYATFRILYGNIPMESLARNMGTSPMMIFRHYAHITNRQEAHILGARGQT